MASKKKAQTFGFSDDVISEMMALDRQRGRFDTEVKWADAVRAVLGAADGPVPPAAVAEKAGLTRNQTTGGLRIIRERGIATVREAGGVRLARTADEKAAWLVRQASAVEADIDAMNGAGKRFPDADAVAAVRAAAVALLERIRAAIPAPPATIVDLAKPSPTPEPAPKKAAKPKKSKTRA